METRTSNLSADKSAICIDIETQGRREFIIGEGVHGTNAKQTSILLTCLTSKLYCDDGHYPAGRLMLKDIMQSRMSSLRMDHLPAYVREIGVDHAQVV